MNDWNGLNDLNLQHEYYAKIRAPADNPERALQLAVLADAVDIVTGAGKRTAKSDRHEYLVLDTVRWFLAATLDAWPFTFLNICERFDYNPAKIIAALGLTDVGRSRPSPTPRPRGRWQIFGERKGRAKYEDVIVPDNRDRVVGDGRDRPLLIAPSEAL